MVGRAGKIRAAINFLRDSGLSFSGPIIRKTITNLLKVYGGDDGWPFIQENGYQLVIDTMSADKEDVDVEQKIKKGYDVGIVDAGEKVVEYGKPISYIPNVADGEPVLQDPIPADNNSNLNIPIGADEPVVDRFRPPDGDEKEKHDPISPPPMKPAS